MAKAIKATMPVFMFLINEKNEVYLQRRFQTGYMDGDYDSPAGKIDDEEFPVEAVIREAEEEAGVIVDESDVELFHTYMNLTGSEPWFGLFFRTRKWEGDPRICEPDKCDDAGFFGLDELPNVIPQVRDALAVVMTAQIIDISEYRHLDPQ